MTTICYKEGQIAYDSRETLDTIIWDDKCEKKFERNGVVYFLAGSSNDAERIMSAYEEGTLEDCDPFQGLVVDKGKVYRIIPGEGSLLIEEERLTNHFAIGSGWHLALSQMDAGRTAKQAVEYAMTRDTNTGGKVKTYKLKGAT